MAVKAFPSAYGGGAYATGGRGGNVAHVTRLDDRGNNSDPFPGTLRWAIHPSRGRPCTVVFDVSGTVVVTRRLNFELSGLTIAGQSSPKGGITITCDSEIKDGAIWLSALNNSIIRYIRFRPIPSITPINGKDQESDAITIYGNFKLNPSGGNLMLDHLSLSYASDENLDLRGKDMKNVTFQRGLIADGKTGALFGDGDVSPTGPQGLWTFNNSFFTTLFVYSSHRLPNIAGKGRYDVVNNVTYDHKWRLINAVAGPELLHLNNFSFKGTRQSLYNGGAKNVNVAIVSIRNISIFSKGNIIEGFFTNPQADNSPLWMKYDGGRQNVPLPADRFMTVQPSYVGVAPPLMTALEASVNVTADSGANKYIKDDGTVGYYQDVPDAHYKNIVQSDTPQPYDYPNVLSEARYLNFIASISTTPVNTRPSSFYVNNPHIPEVWFADNVPTGKDHNSIASSGYTYLEEYLNQVDEVQEDPIPDPQVSTSVITRTDSYPTTIVKGGTYIPPTGIWTDEIDGTGITTIGGDTVNVNILGNYTVILYHTNSSNRTSRISIVYKVIAPIDPEPSENINFPLTDEQIRRGKQAIIRMIKLKTI